MERNIATPDVLDVIFRRFDLLCLLHEQPTDKRGMLDALDTSRSTADRSVRELESHGLITLDDGSYRLTPVGVLAVREVQNFIETIDVASELEPLLRWIPLDELDVATRHFDPRSVVIARQQDPYAPVNRLIQNLQNARQTIRVMLPAGGLRSLEIERPTAIRSVESLEHGCQFVVESVVDDPGRFEAGAVERLQSLLSTDDFEVSVFDGRLPFYLSVADRTVQLGARDDDGFLRGTVESTSPPVERWANAKVDAYRRRSRSLP